MDTAEKKPRKSYTREYKIEAVRMTTEGGIAVAAAEMAFAGGLGMDLYALTVPRPPVRVPPWHP